MTEIDVYEIEITNSKFGSSKYAKIYHETDKAILIGQIDSKGNLYRDHWIPRRFIKIIKKMYGLQEDHHIEVYNDKMEYVLKLQKEMNIT